MVDRVPGRSRAGTLSRLGVWRSLVARSVRVGEVPSSNLGTPIGPASRNPLPRIPARRGWQALKHVRQGFPWLSWAAASLVGPASRNPLLVPQAGIRLRGFLRGGDGRP